MNTKLFIAAFFVFALVNRSFAQQDSKLFLTTGAGIIKVRNSLNDVLKPTIAFNSGLEVTSKKNLFAQATIDFNSLKYDQKLKDNNSPYLFQNTNSSLLVLGINGGKNFIVNNKCFFSGYIGTGYLNIGEPRVTLQNQIVTQQVTREKNIFGRAGARVAYDCPIRFLQKIYLDANWWTSPVKVQGSQLNGFSFFIGTRMGM